MAAAVFLAGAGDAIPPLPGDWPTPRQNQRLTAIQPLPGKMRDDVERRVGQRPAKVARLGVVAEEDERHAGHEADVFHALLVARQR